MGAPKKIRELVKGFELNLKIDGKDFIDEANLRNEYINEFFKCLGWDVENNKRRIASWKEVILERSHGAKGKKKRADYTIRIGQTPVFLVEAKRPSVNIRKDVDSVYQLRKYGWNQRVVLSILTNFEFFAVYDCRKQPFRSERAKTSLVPKLSFHYREYVSRWAEIESMFSKAAIEKGSFDEFAIKKRSGTLPVDEAFLEEIESWRKQLAKDIAKRNRRLSNDQITSVVQRTIDRIIFLRICEGRGIEHEQLIKLLEESNTYNCLGVLFKTADKKYNSGLFYFKKEKNRLPETDEWMLNLKIDDKVIKRIIRQLYEPYCHYQFAMMPADVLGQVYEQFLGKTIKLKKSRRVEIKYKPEVKKAGGVYYTPTYIVDYIVENTVGKLLEKCKTPRTASNLKILDPACGSGSFLIVAYQKLMDWHLEYYIMDGPKKYSRGRKPKIFEFNGEWHLTTGEKKRILLNNIFGVDIDEQAVEVTKLSLLLKVLEGENDRTLQKQLLLFPERVLPDLHRNIRCGNSLIGTDFEDEIGRSYESEKERSQVNAFDWDGEKGFPEIFNRKNPGFDAVIANPPYDVLEKERGKASWPHDLLSDYVRINKNYKYGLGGKLNLFRFFIIRFVHLLRRNGKLGMITPLALLADISCARTRRHLVCCTTKSIANCFPQKDNPKRRVFTKAKLSTVVYTGTRTPKQSEERAQVRVRAFPWNSFNDQYVECLIRLQDTRLLDPENTPIPLLNEDTWRLCKKIHKMRMVVRIAELSDIEVRRGEINQTVYRSFISSNKKLHRLLKGVEFGQYIMHKELSQGKREWFNEKAFLKKHSSYSIIKKRRIATQRITGVDEKLRIVATIIESPAYFADSTNSVSLSEESPYALEYVLGLLNSKMFQWRFKVTSTNNNVGTNEIKSLPFRSMIFSHKKDKARHDRIVKLVETMIDLNKKLPKAKGGHQKEVIQRQIDATNRKIDKLVYELYGLTNREIKIVEEGAL
ncbi:MAG: restriction endonuclease subunit M [Planctomycetota bacterium]|nr:MAG: restriction endonuclease subunit M [Planctomycetota bacterium]